MQGRGINARRSPAIEPGRPLTAASARLHPIRLARRGYLRRPRPKVAIGDRSGTSRCWPSLGRAAMSERPGERGPRASRHAARPGAAAQARHLPDPKHLNDDASSRVLRDRSGVTMNKRRRRWRCSSPREDSLDGECATPATHRLRAEYDSLADRFVRRRPALIMYDGRCAHGANGGSRLVYCAGAAPRLRASTLTVGGRQALFTGRDPPPRRCGRHDLGVQRLTGARRDVQWSPRP